MLISVHFFEAINLVIAVGVIAAVFYSCGRVSVPFILFFYGTFHFAFSVVAFFDFEYRRLLNDLHNFGVGFMALFSGVSVLVVVLLAQVASGYKSALKTGSVYDFPVFFVSALSLLMVFFGFIFAYGEGDARQVLNVSSVLLMVVFVFLYSIFGSEETGSFDKFALPLVGLLVLVVSVAVYELATFKAWSVFWDSDGLAVYRASSILFNPNLFGFWASLIYIASSYGWIASPHKKHLWLVAMLLTAFALYFSGSRSALALLVGVLLLAAVLAASKRALIAPALLVVIVVGIYVLSSIALHGEILTVIKVLGWRYLSAFSDLFGYTAAMFGFSAAVPEEIAVSIEGRFSGESPDAGWLVLYQDSGWCGVLALFFLVAFIFFRLGKIYFSEKSLASVYLIGALLYCLLSGFVMRFQVFPVWVFIVSVMLVALNASRADARRSFKRST